jgi:hypothetical protein
MLSSFASQTKSFSAKPLPMIAPLLILSSTPLPSLAEPAEPSQVVAQSAKGGPFTALSGYWSGGGTITLSNGSSERIRCKATYAVHPRGHALNQNLRCASDSYKLDIMSNVVSDAGAISGTWGEKTRNVSGHLSGHATHAEIRASVAGAGFSAHLDVRTQGNEQSVTIIPQGGTNVSGVTIILRKS